MGLFQSRPWIGNQNLECKKLNNTVLEAIELHQKHIEILKSEYAEKIESAAKLIVDSLTNGGCVYLCGCGGSAADCQHIAGEIVGRFRIERPGYAAVALTTDTSVLTSIANDYGYDEVFRRQVEGLAKKGDVLWAFSTSGSSPSIVSAAEKAKEMGLSVIAFTGKADSMLEQMADVCICAKCQVTSTSQEIHMLAYHIICNLVEQGLVAGAAE